MPIFNAFSRSIGAERAPGTVPFRWFRQWFGTVSGGREEDQPAEVSLLFVFWTFLKIGSVAFGGFMSLISFIETVVVKRHKLITHEEMLDAISLANLLPGPQAVNVVAFVGYRLKGAMGAVIATTSIILPSFLLILTLSYFYIQYGHLPALQNAFQGFIPAIAAIVLSVVWRMGQKTIRGKKEVSLLLFSILVMVLVPLEYKIYAPIVIIVVCGALGYVYFYDKTAIPARSYSGKFPVKEILLPAVILTTLFLLWFIPLPFQNDNLLLLVTFASMSLILFGGGYVFIPIIGSIVVMQYGWVTQQEFTDGIAMGQITPGPILISATFIGFKVAGLTGALVATIGVFGPPALLMVTAAKILEQIKQLSATQAVTRGIHSGVIGLILMAAIVIFGIGFTESSFELNVILPTVLIFIISLIALFKFRLDVVWVIPGSGIAGYLLF